MIVQIYSLTNQDDVRHCIRADVDHVGVAAGSQDLPASISNEKARTLFDQVPDGHRTVALSVHTDVDEICSYARTVEPDILHLCTDRNELPKSAVCDIRDGIPTGMDVMRAIEVDGDEAVNAARDLEAVCDWFILDSTTDDVQGIGAAGEIHDWSISARIVDAVETPVILAGGLSPENVADAIRTVGPAGVDSYTRTSRSERRKDPELVERFVENAQSASSNV